MEKKKKRITSKQQCLALNPYLQKFPSQSCLGKRYSPYGYIIIPWDLHIPWNLEQSTWSTIHQDCCGDAPCPDLCGHLMTSIHCFFNVISHREYGPQGPHAPWPSQAYHVPGGIYGQGCRSLLPVNPPPFPPSSEARFGHLASHCPGLMVHSPLGPPQFSPPWDFGK